MAVAKLTSKGQTTIPRKIRDVLGLKSGDKIDFVVEENGRVYLHPATFDLLALKGILKQKIKKKVSIEEMNEAIIHSALEKGKI